MGSVLNCRKEISMHDAIRWFKCKLKPPEKGIFRENNLVRYCVKEIGNFQGFTTRILMQINVFHIQIITSHFLRSLQ